MKNITVKVSVDISEERVQDILTSAFEGGSNYWYMIDKFIYPEGQTKESLGITFQHVELPFKGGALMISSDGDMPVAKLDLDAITKGLQILAEKYPLHWADIINHNDDADTGDALLQCALFGEIIFG